jgi:hypothetical protein
LVSNLGDALNYIAIVIYVFQFTGSGVDLAKFSLFQIVPSLLIAPIAGVVIDRFSRKKVLIAADIARAVLILGLVFAPLDNEDSQRLIVALDDVVDSIEASAVRMAILQVEQPSEVADVIKLGARQVNEAMPGLPPTGNAAAEPLLRSSRAVGLSHPLGGRWRPNAHHSGCLSHAHLCDGQHPNARSRPRESLSGDRRLPESAAQTNGLGRATLW